MKIKDIQEWEKDFAKRKGLLSPKDKSEAEELLKIAFLKLVEEVGELSEAVLKEQFKEIPAEVSDVIIFACKIGKIVEDYYDQPPLTEILKKKIEYSEKRKYNEKSLSFDKPDGEFGK